MDDYVLVVIWLLSHHFDKAGGARSRVLFSNKFWALGDRSYDT